MNKRNLYVRSTLTFLLILLAGGDIVRLYGASDPVQEPQAVPTGAASLDPGSREARRIDIERQNALANDAMDRPTDVATAPPADLGPIAQRSATAQLIEGPAATQQPMQLAPSPINPGDPRAPILASRRLSYQAVLTDNLGNALPGPTVNLTFNIYTSGAVLVEGPINVAAVPINDGVVDTSFPVSAATFDGSDRLVGVGVNAGPELSPRISLSTVPYALRVDRVASEELDDAITLGRGSAPLASGLLNIQNGVMSQPSIQLVGSQISTYGSDSLEQIRLWGPTYGEILLMDSSNPSNDRTVLLSANSNSGGTLTLYDPDAAIRATFNGSAAGANCILYDGAGSSSVSLRGDLAGKIDAEGTINVVNNIGGIEIASLTTNGTDQGALRTYDLSGDQTVVIGSSGGANSGGLANIHMTDSIWPGITVDGDDGNSGRMTVFRSSNDDSIIVDANSVGGGGAILMQDSDGSETIDIVAAETSTTGGQIVIRDSAGVSQIELDGEFGVTGDPGRVVTPVLQITGGADLSEDFDVSGDNVSPGMVVCIDENNPGKLVVSSTPYDRTVAGIVSGANGVRTGLLMGQKRSPTGDVSIADGKLPIALTGRVYCLVDAAQAEVVPGDLLTTSGTPGHAMKVLDYGKAQGAVIGKAMTPLAQGEKGLVLVLVTMQ